MLRYGAVADASAHQTFSVTKKVEGDLPEAAKDLDYTLEITLKNAADPTVNKTFEATIKAGETYTYPAPLPPGTEVTVSEGICPRLLRSPGMMRRVVCLRPPMASRWQLATERRASH